MLATGAEERPLVFGGNDRPGVMLASAMRAYVNRYAVAPGARAVVFTNNSSGYRTARDVLAAGIDVAAVIDARDGGSAASQVAGVPLIRDGVVTAVVARERIAGIHVLKSGQSNADRIEADFVAMSGGWNPVIHLSCHKGEKPVWDAERACFLPPSSTPGLTAVGAAAGAFTLSQCLKDGSEAGARAAERAGATVRPILVPPARDDDEPYAIRPLWHVKQSTAKAFVDFQNDVTLKDIPLAAREGFSSIELLKRYTTSGMATDQGKLSNINASGILAEATGRSVATSRHHDLPAVLHAGVVRRADRRLPRHPFPAGAQDAAARLVRGDGRGVHGGRAVAALRLVSAGRRGLARCRHPRGAWRCASRSASAMSRRSARSTFRGRMPRTLLNRLYCNGFSTLQPGKARYGLMLREDGFLFDDGTVSHLAPGHYFLDHHHRQCRPGHVAYRVLPPGTVAGARRAICLRHRPMGPDRGGRTQFQAPARTRDRRGSLR